jgi:glucosamine--fructose-6-phosphate aminotransferase (isomerizing)
MPETRGTFTKTEILSQPETWKETLQYLRSDWSDKLPDPKHYDQIVITGCGSTYYLSIWAARFLHSSSGVPTIALPSSELWYSGDTWLKPFKKVLFIAISRSGQTTETLHALDSFLKTGSTDALAITCYKDSSLAKMSPLAITTISGMEQSVAQTRSFSNMMWPIILLGEREIPENTISAVHSAAKAYLSQYQDTARQIGSDLTIDRFFFLGNGPLFGLAQEVMLKMKEMSLSYSEAFHFLEFRHGPMSMVNPQSLIIGFTNDKSYSYELPVFRDMQKLGGRTLAVGKISEKPQGIDYLFDIGKNVPSNWSFPFYLPLIQLLAYERSMSKGLNPDKPENLTAVVEL